MNSDRLDLDDPALWGTIYHGSASEIEMAALALVAELRASRERVATLTADLWRVLVRADALLDSAADADVDGMTPVSVDSFDDLVGEVEDLKRARADPSTTDERLSKRVDTLEGERAEADDLSHRYRNEWIAERERRTELERGIRGHSRAITDHPVAVDDETMLANGRLWSLLDASDAQEGNHEQ